MNDNFLEKKLQERKSQEAFRQLKVTGSRIDFCSNDYLGVVKNNLISAAAPAPDTDFIYKQGSTGSRLLSGNYRLIEEVEAEIAAFHDAEAGLIYNSGYDANVGLLSCIAQREDTIIYDYLSHASIRDGARLSFAQAYSFSHNDLTDLEKKLKAARGRVFVVTESVFSMDGDLAPLKEIAALCENYEAALIVDEAHATGIIGQAGEGLVQQVKIQDSCFARIHTFGKACGVHGSIVLGSQRLRDYLINFSRAFIYTTALPESSIHAIQQSYKIFPLLTAERQALQKLITFFQETETMYPKLISNTPIQAVIIPGNKQVKKAAEWLQEEGIDVRAILHPTVPKGEERLRVVLHSFNHVEQLSVLVKSLNKSHR